MGGACGRGLDPVRLRELRGDLRVHVQLSVGRRHGGAEEDDEHRRRESDQHRERGCVSGHVLILMSVLLASRMIECHSTRDRRRGREGSRGAFGEGGGRPDDEDVSRCLPPGRKRCEASCVCFFPLTFCFSILLSSLSPPLDAPSRVIALLLFREGIARNQALLVE